MAFRARVYLKRPLRPDEEYLGEIDLDLRPVREGRTSFMHDGETVVGHIDGVTPPDWDETGAIPTVHVVLRGRG